MLRASTFWTLANPGKTPFMPFCGCQKNGTEKSSLPLIGGIQEVLKMCPPSLPPYLEDGWKEEPFEASQPSYQLKVDEDDIRCPYPSFSLSDWNSRMYQSWENHV